MAKFVYHRMPVEMRGQRIYPLNDLKNIYPDVFANHVKKYEGRESLMSVKVGILNCLWNDVVHLSPVSPQTLFDAIQQGRRCAGDISMADAIVPAKTKWLKIPIEMLDSSKAVIFLNPPERELSDYCFSEHDYGAFDPKSYEEVETVPSHMIEYYAREFRSGRRPLLFARLPHVFFRGTVDATNLEIIEPSASDA